MTYPPAPWNMHGQLWLSLFRVREGDHPDREPGCTALRWSPTSSRAR